VRPPLIPAHFRFPVSDDVGQLARFSAARWPDSVLRGLECDRPFEASLSLGSNSVPADRETSADFSTWGDSYWPGETHIIRRRSRARARLFYFLLLRWLESFLFLAHSGHGSSPFWMLARANCKNVTALTTICSPWRKQNLLNAHSCAAWRSIAPGPPLTRHCLPRSCAIISDS